MNKTDKKKKKFRFIPGFIRHDFLRKLIALFFAVLIWQRVDSEIAEPDTLRDIPVQISLPANLERTNETPIRVSLKVKASRRILNNLSLNDINIKVKLNESSVHKNSLAISYRIDPKKDISLPSGITVLQVTPETIEISVDRKVSKTVPVELICSGVLLDGYSFRESAVIPKQVIITGPQSIIDPMKEIKTQPIILKTINVEDFECDVKLDIKNNVVANRAAVTAQIEIYKKYDVREFSNMSIKTYGSAASPCKAILQPPQAFIIIKGVKKSVEIMQETALHPFVDISGLKVPGKYSLKIKCWADDKDVRVKEIKPKKIDVELKKPK